MGRMIEKCSHGNDELVPEGSRFLRGMLELSARCEIRSDALLMPVQARHELGTLLSLLDRVSSCWWGCNGGDHKAEYLVGRSCNCAMGAFMLARSGFYDESLSLTRSLGEIANLAYLLSTDPEARCQWKNVDPDKTRREFSPVEVRRALEKRGKPVPIDKSRYRQLSEKATHPTPHIPPGMYNEGKLPVVAGLLQEAGLYLCLAELGYALSIVGPCAISLCGIQGDPAERVDRASANLGRALASLRDRVNVSFPGTYS
jgi:hypothetical protein